jgi:hypothetical protein
MNTELTNEQAEELAGMVKAECRHEGEKRVGYDEVTCRDCGWITPSGQHMGPHNGWFPSHDAHKQFKKYGTYPGMDEARSINRNAAPAPPSAPVHQSVQGAEAVKERDKLGYTVCQVIAAVESLVAGAEEYEGDDGFLHQGAPIELWSALNDALDGMLPRAEEFEAKYQALSTSPLPDKNDQTEGETESLSEPFGTLVIYQDGTEVFKRAGEPFPPTAYGYVAIELFSHPKSPQPDSNELAEAVKSYLAALDGWENTNKAEKRVERAEFVMRKALAQSPSVGLNTKKGG